jgi:hypothetical protein
MNWYDIIEGDENRLPNFFMATKFELFSRDSNDIKIGDYISDWNSETRLWSNEQKWDGMPDDILANALGWPIFSRRLREAIAQQGIGIGDIQYLPINVARSTGEELIGFAVANVITRLPALVPEHTKMYRTDNNTNDPLTGKPKVTSAWKTALRAELVQDHDVVRLLEYSPPILVSERFVEIFNNNGFTGATFTRVPVV